MRKKRLLRGMAVAAIVLGAGQLLGGQDAKAKEITYNVEKYGVKGDGVEDVSYSLTKLLKEADTMSSGDTLVLKFPKGTYKVGSLLRIYSNTTLDLSEGAELYRDNPEQPLMMNVGEGGSRKEDDPSGGGYALSENITITGGVINGGDIEHAQTGGNVVNFAHAQNITVQDVTFKNCYGAHLLELSGVKDAKVAGCDFSGFRPEKSSKAEDVAGDSSNANKSGYAAKECIQLDYTYFDPEKSMLQWCPGYYSDKTACKDVVIENNTFHDYPRGVGNHHGQETFANLSTDNITIRNNTFSNMYVTAPNGKKVYDYAISLHSFKNAKIEDNIINNAGSAVLCAYDENSTINNNQMEALDWSAIVLTKHSKGSTIKDNTLSDVARYGISVTNGSNVAAFSENIMRAGAKKVSMLNAITVNGADSYIASVLNNHISNCSKFGISLLNVKKAGDIIGNDLTSCAKGAICIAGSNCNKVSDNHVVGVAKINSITVCKKSEVRDLSGNSIEKSGKHAISISSSKLTNVNGNTIKGSAGNGICTTAATITNIRYNRIAGAKKAGIVICKKSSIGNISKNTFSKIKGKKIGVDKTSKVKTKK